MAGYTLIYFVFALVLAVAGGFMLYFSWRFVENQWVTSRTLPVALISGFIVWFLLSLVLILTLDSWQAIAIRFFGGNGFSMALIVAMLGVLLHHQLLVFLNRK